MAEGRLNYERISERSPGIVTILRVRTKLREVICIKFYSILHRLRGPELISLHFRSPFPKRHKETFNRETKRRFSAASREKK